MGYRRNKPEQPVERAWQQWLDDHAHVLVALHLPLELYSSRVAWEEFLATGSAVLGMDNDRREFDFNDLAVEQQKKLHAFLEREFGSDARAPGLLGFLRVRASHGWVPPFC